MGEEEERSGQYRGAREAGEDSVWKQKGESKGGSGHAARLLRSRHSGAERYLLGLVLAGEFGSGGGRVQGEDGVPEMKPLQRNLAVGAKSSGCADRTGAGGVGRRGFGEDEERLWPVWLLEVAHELGES